MRRFLAEAKFHRQHRRLLAHPSVSRRTKALKGLMADAKKVEAEFYKEVQLTEAKIRRSKVDSIHAMRRRIIEGTLLRIILLSAFH